MALKTLPATEVKNRFGRVLREVNQTDTPIVIERDGKPVAVIMSMSEYERWRQGQAQPIERDLLQTAFGVWADRNDIDEEWLANGRSRWESNWRGQDG